MLHWFVGWCFLVLTFVSFYCPFLPQVILILLLTFVSATVNSCTAEFQLPVWHLSDVPGQCHIKGACYVMFFSINKVARGGEWKHLPCMDWGQSSIGAGCPEKWGSLHYWRFSRPNWIKPRATWSDYIADSVLSTRLDRDLLRSPSYPLVSHVR